MASGNIFKKIAQLFKTAKRPPPPRFGDGKYDSEEDGTDLKAGIIKELTGRSTAIPHDLDVVLEFIKLAKAGGKKVTPSEVSLHVMLIVA
jgi:hypothetical protein